MSYDKFGKRNYCIIIQIIHNYNYKTKKMPPNPKPLLSSITTFLKLQKLKRNLRKLAFLGTTITYFAVCGWYLLYTESGQTALQKSLSNSVTYLAKIQLPIRAREVFYGKYVAMFGVDLGEMEKELVDYKNFQEFFTRKIKPRPQYKQNLQNPKAICSPCDAQILTISKITQDNNLIIKDISYSLSSLLSNSKPPQNFPNSLLTNPQNDLHQIILYLCPGDYHRFHAPYGITVRSYREIEGLLRPVNLKSIVKNGGIVYERNARKVLHCLAAGRNGVNGGNGWYLGLVMVGALNVGNIVLNQKVAYEKGEEIGYFNLGSTIVMIMESPPNMKWNKKSGDKVKFGQKLCEFQ